MMPERIQLSRRKGWRMPANTVKVDRSTRHGNPFIAGTHGTKLQCTGFYAMTIDGNFALSEGVDLDAQVAIYDGIRDAAADLRGKNLACWCSLPAGDEPDACHARVMLEFINQVPREGSHTDRIMRAWQTSKRHTDFYIDVEQLIMQKHRETMQVIMDVLTETFPDTGLCLFVFDQHAGKPRANYISNTERSQTLGAIKEWVRRQEVL